MAKSLIVQRLDGTTYDLEAEGIRVVTFDPPSPNYQSTYSQVGKYGARLVNTEVQQTSIPLIFDVFATDNYDYELQRIKVMRIFDSQEPFYIINSRIPYLRYKVQADAFMYPRLSNYWKAKSVSINLVAYEGYMETVATSLHLFDDENAYVGFGMGLKTDEIPQYSFSNVSKLIFNNIGRIPLLADERPVKLTFKGDAPNGLTIINHTTGQTFKYLHALKASDEFVLDGLIPLVNGVQRLGNSYSTHSYLDYLIGKNEIELVGASNFIVQFETRFYY